jgi:hypothetical protein
MDASPHHADDLPVRSARDAYLAENGFTLDSYEADRVPIALFGITFRIPNTHARKRAVRWHDLHHVATGFGTDPAGEGEISAWELRRGLSGLGLYVGAIVIGGTALGFLVAPKRTWRAWVASGDGHQNFFVRDVAEYEGMLNMNVAELREHLHVPPTGIARERGLHAAAPRT